MFTIKFYSKLIVSNRIAEKTNVFEGEYEKNKHFLGRMRRRKYKIKKKIIM